MHKRRAQLLMAVVMALSAQAMAVPSLAGVHFYSGDISMLDQTLPLGERGWNVEGVWSSDTCLGDMAGVRSRLSAAKNAGLVNILRVDYRSMVAVPPGAYDGWVNEFNNCISKTSDLVSHYIVGNEPNIEGGITPTAYAAAFDYLYPRKVGGQLLAVHNSPFTDPAWITSMASQLDNVDGFAFHTGGARPGCLDPRVACSYGGWTFDGAFRYYRSVIDAIPSTWWSKPIYITEFNTYTGDPNSQPDTNYPANWANQAFEDVRNYNASRGSKPRVAALIWFVDDAQGQWTRWSLRNVSAARIDMGEEFKNCANRSCSPPPSSCTLGVTPSGSNLATSATCSASSTYGTGWDCTKAKDGALGTKWASADIGPPHTLTYDLGANQNINGYIVYHAEAGGEQWYYNTQQFSIETATSAGGPWTPQTTVNNSSQTASSHACTHSSAISARYVRLVLQDPGPDNVARIPEFQVRGSAVSLPPPSEDFNAMPAWSSSFDATWGGAATWSIVTSGQSGNGLRATRANTGSSAKVKVYAITANRSYTATVWARCAATSGFWWAEAALKPGNHSAQDFDGNYATWQQIKKFEPGGTNCNGNVWTQYSTTFYSGSNTQLSVGFKLGLSSGTAPIVRWDTLRVQ